MSVADRFRACLRDIVRAMLRTGRVANDDGGRLP